MSHLDPTRPQTPRELRQFGLTVGAAFLVLGAVFAWRRSETVAAVLGGAGATLVLAGLLVPAHLGPVYRGWMRFSVALSRITTPVFMGLIYFGLFAPLGLVMRLFGRRTLSHPPRSASFWVPRPEGARASDLRRQF